MTGPRPLNPVDQDQLLQQTTVQLVHTLPPGWEEVEIDYRAAGRYVEMPVTVHFVTGATQSWNPPPEVGQRFAELRAGMYRPGRGTWFSARFQLNHPDRYSIQYNRTDEPSWHGQPPPPAAFVDELRFFPRDEENTPEWLRQRAGQLRQPQPPVPPVAPPPAAQPGPGQIGPGQVGPGQPPGPAQPGPAGGPPITPEEDATLRRLRQRLDELGVPPTAYRVGGAAERAWCLIREPAGWLVFWSERGAQLHPVGFDTVDQAAAQLVGTLLLSPVPGEPAPPHPASVGAPQGMSAQGGQPGVGQPVPPPSPALQPGPVAPGPVQPGPVQPGPVQPGAVQPGPIQPGAVQPGPGHPAPGPQGPAPVQQPSAPPAQHPQPAPSSDATAPVAAFTPLPDQAPNGQRAEPPVAGQEPAPPLEARQPEPPAEPEPERPSEITPLPGEPPLTLFQDVTPGTLSAGTDVDRFGTPEGNLTYAAGTPFPHRSLPADWVSREYHVYRVMRPVPVLSGVAIPWFGQPGGGTAHVLPRSIKELLDDGSLAEIPGRAGPSGDDAAGEESG
ncbi:Protein of unknown function (DUF4237) [Streptoalloteichus tenebrarius]|uniref:TNT domain-containing protein n=1 Tax=Streptoalloteichus tenebrarius (strain ATCC 17920 / DSM 40477 / JCM 4838 / CBS 697.72 / NBRC 16177 / NCIMB 11028 / NRRL B-12390 / A12253. 1 / ISP 5477) TaxID=1933 RepID=A0ABT1I182_STRSD|nr:glycohydrolase toxin TNT-related protein [Streptoalloteichus tenebrarius]MCP2261552.1 Protein of unknown function (DUF4237) [Streptoalloteichus tenebrarius]BFF02673.1 hypothetical protein GCM10020241_43480 [Streptoalloteichus tenebrarius]